MAKTVAVLGARNLGGAIIDPVPRAGLERCRRSAQRRHAWASAAKGCAGDRRRRSGSDLTQRRAHDCESGARLARCGCERGDGSASHGGGSVRRRRARRGGPGCVPRLDGRRGRASVRVPVGRRRRVTRTRRRGAEYRSPAVQPGGRCRARDYGQPARSRPAPWYRPRRRSYDRRASTRARWRSTRRSNRLRPRSSRATCR